MILVRCSSSVQQLTLGDREQSGGVAQCGEFGFELSVLIQDD